MANEVAISLPFTVDQTGKVAYASTQEAIWADRVKSIIGTAVRERVMNPNIGTLIPYALFESQNDAIREVKAEVEKAFSLQLPYLTLIAVNVSLDPTLNVITADLQYALPNGVDVNTNLGVISIIGNKPSYEELS